jgi:hypothetical protein
MNIMLPASKNPMIQTSWRHDCEAIMKQCQSCGMPMDKDPGGGGSEKDGGKSQIYCSLCYRDGEFIGEDCTVEEMQDIVEQAMKKQGFGWPMRKMARLQIPRLARWRERA